MPFAAGVFTRIHNWVQDRTIGEKIKAARHDEEDDGFAVGLTNTICRDGQSTILADTPWNGKKITELGLATAGGDALNRDAGDARYKPRAGTSPQTSAYTVVAADLEKAILCSGTWTLGFTAATMLGSKFSCYVKNTGTGVITLDPNGSETIDGATTVKLYAGESCPVVCDGMALTTLGRPGSTSSTFGASGASSDFATSGSFYRYSSVDFVATGACLFATGKANFSNASGVVVDIILRLTLFDITTGSEVTVQNGSQTQSAILTPQYARNLFLMSSLSQSNLTRGNTYRMICEALRGAAAGPIGIYEVDIRGIVV